MYAPRTVWVTVVQALLLNLSLFQSKSTDKAPLLTIPFLEVSPPRNDAFLANRKLLHRKREADGLDVFAEDKGFCQLKYSHVEVQKDGVEERMLDDPCYVDSHRVLICSI